MTPSRKGVAATAKMRAPAVNSPSRYAVMVHEALGLADDIDDLDVIQFQCNSRNVAVGVGKGERLTKGSTPARYDAFVRLNGRSVLSNMHKALVTVEGRTYPSAEHAFHAGKAMLTGAPETAAMFEVGGEYGRLEPSSAKRYGGRKHLTMSAEALAQWNAHAATARMRSVLAARLAQDDAFRQALKATGNALLVHQIRGNTAETRRLSLILHELRDTL